MSCIRISIIILCFFGFWKPDNLTKTQETLYKIWTVLSFFIWLGIYLITQLIDLFMVWGNLPLMTATAFLLFTNLAHTTKIVNVVWRRKDIQRIIDNTNAVLDAVDTDEAEDLVQKNNRETSLLQGFYFILTTITIMGWAGSSEKKQLPLRAWYPFDTSVSPNYELVYTHQVCALFVDAYLNIAKDTLVATLTAQCRCRLQLINLQLKNIHQGIGVEDNSQELLSEEQEIIVKNKLKDCIKQHQDVLASVAEVQRCFSAPTFAQFTVSLVIICVTAFQMSSQFGNPLRLISMTTYLLNMSYQVFIYCYQGDLLKEESTKITGYAYECLWYRSSISFRRSLLNIMLRSQRASVLNAGGFTNLSLQSFMAIIKASYSFFTVLQQVDAGNN